MDTPKGAQPGPSGSAADRAGIGQAVIVTANADRVRQVGFELEKRGYRVAVVDAERFVAPSRPYDLGVFDLSSGSGNPVVLAADLLADGRLQHVEFILPGPRSASEPVSLAKPATVQEPGPGIERTHADPGPQSRAGGSPAPAA